MKGVRRVKVRLLGILGMCLLFPTQRSIKNRLVVVVIRDLKKIAEVKRNDDNCYIS